jgi:hypothetical protein
MTDFTLKFIDGSPTTEDYAAKLAAFNRSIWECDITEEDELIMGPYWLLPIEPFRVDHVQRGICPNCDSETEIRIGHDRPAPATAPTGAVAGVLINGENRTEGPLKAVEECPRCGRTGIDPEIYATPHNERL